MSLLIAGLVLWISTHFFKRLAPEMRANLTTRLGAAPARGVISLVLLAALVMIVIGYRIAPVEFVYATPGWAGHANNAMMVVAVALWGMGQSKGRARTWLRHPMLLGVIVWAVAHLLVNGDVASIVLFGGLMAWAVVSMVFINLQDGKWERPAPGPAAGDVKWLVITAVVFAVIAGLHIWIGPSPFGV